MPPRPLSANSARLPAAPDTVVDGVASPAPHEKSIATPQTAAALIFISSFSGGEVFRSGCTFRRGHGKIFYLKPGD